MNNHPSVIAVQNTVISARAETHAIRAEGRPVLSVLGRYENDDNNRVGVNFSIPLFSGFSDLHRTRVSRI